MKKTVLALVVTFFGVSCTTIVDNNKKDEVVDTKVKPLNLKNQSQDKGGGLTASEINSQIRLNKKLFRDCYSELRKREKDAAGGIKLNFVIGAEGKVISSKVKEISIGLKDLDFKQCMLASMNALIFPMPRGGGNVTVNYPFELSVRPTSQESQK